MTPESTRADDEAQIRGLLEDWVAAARANDLDGIMAVYAPDIRSFDAIAQLQFKGADAYRKHWEWCIGMCSSPILEIHDLAIETGGDVAFGHYLLRCGGRAKMARNRSGGCASPSATGGRTDGGWSRTSISRLPSRWKAARRCSTSSPRPPKNGRGKRWPLEAARQRSVDDHARPCLGDVRRGERPSIAGPQAIERGRAGAADAATDDALAQRPFRRRTMRVEQ
jgi:ketosteroid isomerase-like protein